MPDGFENLALDGTRAENLAALAGVLPKDVDVVIGTEHSLVAGIAAAIDAVFVKAYSTPERRADAAELRFDNVKRWKSIALTFAPGLDGRLASAAFSVDFDQNTYQDLASAAASKVSWSSSESGDSAIPGCQFSPNTTYHLDRCHSYAISARDCEAGPHTITITIAADLACIHKPPPPKL